MLRTSLKKESFRKNKDKGRAKDKWDRPRDTTEDKQSKEYALVAEDQ